MSETAAVPAPDLPAPAPPDDAVREYALHPRVQQLWFWQWLIVVALISLPGLIATSVAIGPLATLPVLGLGALAMFQIVRYGRRYVAMFRCALLPDGLKVHRGVWWRSEVFVPRTRIQHTDVSQGPIARQFGIAKLQVYTAGTHSAEIDIGGLAHTDAVALRDDLLGRHGHDAV